MDVNKPTQRIIAIVKLNKPMDVKLFIIKQTKSTFQQQQLAVLFPLFLGRKVNRILI